MLNAGKNEVTPRRKPIRVSIIDNDAEARRAVANHIRNTKGFDCVGEYSSAGCVSPGDEPDIVLTDVDQPEADIGQWVRHLKAQLPKSQCVILSHREDLNHIRGALAAGAMGYLSKRSWRKELAAALVDVHHGGAPMSGTIARKVVQTFHRGEHERPVLSPREMDVLKLIAAGATRKEAAVRLSLSDCTVNSHIEHILKKLQARTSAEAVARFTRFYSAARLTIASAAL